DRKVDLGVYPVEGASQVARGHVNAVSILVAVEPGGFAHLPAVSQMEKFVAGPGARGAIDLDDPVADNLRRIAFARDVRVQDIAVAITGVTGGPLLAGVAFGSGYAETSSLVMSSRHSTVRRLTTQHHLAGGGS